MISDIICDKKKEIEKKKKQEWEIDDSDIGVFIYNYSVYTHMWYIVYVYLNNACSTLVPWSSKSTHARSLYNLQFPFQG